jgi:hypothetical protein
LSLKFDFFQKNKKPNMNIFFLHVNPKKSAQFYFNKHCIKIILEICQMLYTAHWCGQTSKDWVFNHNQFFQDELEPYRKTHFNHPTAKWVRQHTANYLYATTLGLELCYEYTRRYGKIHKCQQRLEWLMNNIPPMCNETIQGYLSSTSIPEGCTPVPLAMPDEYKCPDLVQSYRAYYLGAKAEMQDKVITTEYLKSIWNTNTI